MEGSHEIDGDLLKGITLIDGHEGMSLSFRVSVSSLTDLAPVDEILDHLLKSGKVKIPPYSGEGCSDPHVSTFLSVGVKENFWDHLVGDTDLDFFLP